jgi:hypothetical protein
VLVWWTSLPRRVIFSETTLCNCHSKLNRCGLALEHQSKANTTVGQPTMSIQLFFDYGLFILFPFFYLATNGLSRLILSSATSTSTTQSFKPSPSTVHYHQLSSNLTMSVYLAIAGVLLLVLWVAFICYVDSGLTYDPLWANEWHPQTTNSHYWVVDPSEREHTEIEALKLLGDATHPTYALEALPAAQDRDSH